MTETTLREASIEQSDEALMASVPDMKSRRYRQDPRHHSPFGILLVLLLILTPPGTHRATAQPTDHALMVGLGAGLTLYHGEFNSLQDPFAPLPNLTFAAGLQYNVSQVFAFGGAIASSTLCYRIDPFARTKYASNFFGPVEATTYPGSTATITEDNRISTTSLFLYGKVYLDGILPEDWTLFGHGGIGMIGFTPRNTEGDQLPKDLTGPYDETSLMIPFGGGAEYRIVDKLRAFIEYTFHSGFTDYLDGYAHYLDYETTSIPSGPGATPTQSDHHSTLRVGVMYQIYRNAPDPSPADSPAPAPSGEDRGDTPLGEETEPAPPPADDRTDADDFSPDPGEPPPSAQPTPESPSARPPEPAAPPAHERIDNADAALRPKPVEELDTDGDRLSDREETDELGTDPLSPDSDGDGLTDGEEVRLYATDPLAADSDGDLLSDLREVRHLGTSPRASDTDRDLLGDNEEISRTGTDPLAADSDGDGVIDGEDDCPLTAGSPQNRGCPGSADEATAENSERQTEAPLPMLEDGIRKEFSNIYFRQNSDEFDFERPETEQSLNALRDYLASCEEVGVLIEGHTSSEGNPDWNLKLSQMRADRVRQWLLGEGIESRKILGTIGYGSRLPKLMEPDPTLVSPEAVERIRAQNRRITTLLRIPCS